LKLRVALALAGILLSACHVRAPHGPGTTVSPQDVDYGHLVYQATLEEGTRKRRFRLALAFSGRQKFRLEILGPVGGPRVILTSDGADLQAMFPPQRLFARSPATPENMEILLGLPLFPEEFLGLLMGFPPPDAPWRAGPRPGSPVQLEYERGESGRPTRAEVRVTGEHGGVTVHTVEYLDPGEGPWGRQAQQVHLLVGERGLRLRLKNAVRKLPSPEAFRQRAPSRFSEVALGELPPFLLFQGEDAP